MPAAKTCYSSLRQTGRTARDFQSAISSTNSRNAPVFVVASIAKRSHDEKINLLPHGAKNGQELPQEEPQTDEYAGSWLIDDRDGHAPIGKPEYEIFPQIRLTVALRQVAQRTARVNVGLTSGYGIGFDVERRDDYVAFEHRGTVAGYTPMLLINRAKGIGVIVLCHGAANPASLAERALDILSK